MAFLNVKNRAKSALAADITSTATSLNVATGEGAKFPDSNFHITIDDEILLCTSRTTDTLTVERAKEGTTAAAHNAGKAVELRITAQIITELQAGAGFESKARVYLAGVQSIPATIWTKVLLDTENFDGLDEFDSVTNHRFTAQAAGYYIIVGCTTYADPTVQGKNYGTGIYKNGTSYVRGDVTQYGTGYFGVNFVDIVYLAVGDYLELYTYHNEASNRNLYAASDSTFLTVHRLS